MLLPDMTVRQPEHWVSFMCGIHPKDDDDVLQYYAVQYECQKVSANIKADK